MLFVCVAFSPVVVSAGDVEHRFVRIFVPMEQDKYINTIPNIAGNGYFYFLDKQWKPEELRIRIRVYRPIKEDFELLQEHDAKIGRPLPNEPATLLYVMDIKPKKPPKPGKYLYRVDCFDKSGKEEKLLASNSIFITFVEDEKPLGPLSYRPRPAKTHRVSRVTRRIAPLAVKSNGE